jgi:PAS domain S-box-containing protein
VIDANDLPPDFSELRRRAEAKLEAEASSSENLSPAEAARLIHELRVHQIELEMQNEELRLSQTRLEQQVRIQATVLERLAEGVTLTDSRGTILYTNPAFDSMFGYEPGELPGQHSNILNFCPPNENLAMVREILQQINTAGSWIGEFRNRRKNGSPFNTLARISSMEVNDKKLFISVQEDITERQRAEAARREALDHFQTLFDTSPLPILSTDLQGLVRSWNPAAERLFGWKAEEVIGRPLPTVPEEHREELAEMFQQEREGQFFLAKELQRLTRDGTVIDVALFSAPLRDAQGKTVGFMGILENITERKRTEAARRESERQFRQVVESLPQLVWTCQPDGSCDFLSRQWLEYTGLPEADQLGYGWLNQVHPDDRNELTKTWEASVATGADFSMEFRLRRHDGIYQWFDTRAVPWHDPDGNIVKWFGSNTEIHSQRELREALCRARDELEMRVQERTDSLRLANEKLLVEIEDRHKMENRLRESEARFTAFLEYLPGLAVMRDMEGRYLFANRAWEESMGLEPVAWRGKILEELWAPERAAYLHKLDFQIISSGKPVEEVEVQVLADGPHHFLTKRFPIRGADGLPYMVGAIAIDVTARRRAEQQVAETSRLYRILSQVNEVIMRGWDQEFLFQRVCRIAVEEGLFQMAWVGLLDPSGQNVRVAAKYGFDEGYLDDLLISVKDGDHSRGPTGTAIREDRYDICNDFAYDPRMAPWRDQALARGYRSSGAFPLRVDGRVVGAIAFYAARPDYFTDKEIALLTSLADNLSFALESLDREEKRRRSEEEIRKQAALLDLAHDAIIVREPDSKIVFWSRGAEDTYGWQKEKALGQVTHVLLKTKFPVSKEDVDQALLQKGLWGGELLHTRADESVITVASRQVLQKDEKGQPVAILEINRDITERKKAEEALKESEIRLRHLAKQLLNAQENERKRLASELHDELGHALLALRLHLSSIEKRMLPEQEGLKDEMRSQLDYINEVIKKIRRLYYDLSPGDVEDLGLTKALHNLIRDFAVHVPQITWQVDLMDLEGLFSLPVQTIIYRIVQEALTNIGKHAKPEQVTVIAAKARSQVHFVIQDDGQGFDVARVLAATGRGVGLAAMGERLNMVGGSFEIHSRKQEGTRLSFTIPTLPGEPKPRCPREGS